MNNFSKVECNAINKCESYYIEEDKKLKGFSKLYPFTTENIAGYIDNFNLKNKSLLTVGSSGDQVINAALKGCQDITVLDINQFTKFYYYLKSAAIINLTYNDFLKFLKYRCYPSTFKNNEKDVLKFELYDKLRDYLRKADYESYLFWEELLFNYDGKTIRTRLFTFDEGQIKENRGCNNYLKTEDNYNKAKKYLQSLHPTFINNDILDIHLDRSFDNIWLSNIANYMQKEEIKQMIENMDKYLKIGGKMLVSYLYQIRENTLYQKNWPIIYNLDEIRELLSNYPLEKLIEFQSTRGIIFDESKGKDAWTDCILTYKKR